MMVVLILSTYLSLAGAVFLVRQFVFNSRSLIKRLEETHYREGLTCQEEEGEAPGIGFIFVGGFALVLTASCAAATGLAFWWVWMPAFAVLVTCVVYQCYWDHRRSKAKDRLCQVQEILFEHGSFTVVRAQIVCAEFNIHSVKDEVLVKLRPVLRQFVADEEPLVAGEGAPMCFGHRFVKHDWLTRRYMKEIMRIAGVGAWPELRGIFVRIEVSGRLVHSIGHCERDQWLNNKMFLNHYGEPWSLPVDRAETQH